MDPIPPEIRTGTDYDHLPEAIRHTLPFRNWQFMTDAQRASLERDETCPDWVGRTCD